MKRRLRTILHRCGFVPFAFLFGCAPAEPAKVVDDAKCSPNADAWHQLALWQTCGRTPVEQCPESDGIGEEYERRALEECTRGR